MPCFHPARLICLALLLLVEALAHAGAPFPSCDDDPTCQPLFDEGLTHFKAGHFNEAEQSFARAYALRADPVLLYNLARALHKAGRPREAVPYYQQFLNAGRPAMRRSGARPIRSATRPRRRQRRQFRNRRPHYQPGRWPRPLRQSLLGKSRLWLLRSRQCPPAQPRQCLPRRRRLRLL